MRVLRGESGTKLLLDSRAVLGERRTRLRARETVCGGDRSLRMLQKVLQKHLDGPEGRMVERLCRLFEAGATGLEPATPA